MREFLWRRLAAILSSPRVRRWIVLRAVRTPYRHLDGYMMRWWFFNSYENPDGTYPKRNWLMRRLPSIRVHQLLRGDNAYHMHDHPWDARTIILQGGYLEQCEDEELYERRAGDTRAIRFGEYHHIHDVIDSVPTLTLFFTWKYMGTWGFSVDGQKVPWREYLEQHPDWAN